MIKTRIEDGAGRGQSAHVEDNALMVTLYGCPPLVPQKNRVFSQYLTDDGTTAGSNDMGIDGSVTGGAPFWVDASSDADLYIASVSFAVGYGGSAPMYEFSDSTLVSGTTASGFRFYYERSEGEIEIATIKNNGELLRLMANGIVPNIWETRNFAAVNDYGYIGEVNFLKFLPPYGLKLDIGTNQKLVFHVRDNNTNADVMNAIAYGFERFP